MSKPEIKQAVPSWFIWLKSTLVGFFLLFGGIHFVFGVLSFFAHDEEEFFSQGILIGSGLIAIAFFIIPISRIEVKLLQILTKIQKAISSPIFIFLEFFRKALGKLLLGIIAIFVLAPIFYGVYKIGTEVGAIPVSIVIGAIIIAYAIQKNKSDSIDY